jgi:hypothetical protein
MSAVWTCSICCFSCDKEFIVNRLSLADAYTALTMFVCPYCWAVPTASQPHRLNYLQSVNSPYRKKRASQVWHYSEYCSHWPHEGYVEIDFPPRGQVCNECRALAGS